MHGGSGEPQLPPVPGPISQAPPSSCARAHRCTSASVEGTHRAVPPQPLFLFGPAAHGVSRPHAQSWVGLSYACRADAQSSEGVGMGDQKRSAHAMCAGAMRRSAYVRGICTKSQYFSSAW